MKTQTNYESSYPPPVSENYIVEIPQSFVPQYSFVAIDFETATFNRMACQIGIAIVKDGEIIDQQEILIQPPQNIYDIQTTRVHNITPETTSNAPTFDVIWPKLKEIFNNQLIVTHNADFDLDVLKKNLIHYNIDEPHIRYMCTCKLLGGASLFSACEYFHINLPLHHNALSDAVACAKLLLQCNKLEQTRFCIPKLTESKFNAHRHLSSDVKRQDLVHCKNKNTIFYDKKVVITGTLDNFIEREHLAKLLKDLGADINSSISKKTNIVVAGKGAGPKKMAQINEINSSGAGCIRLIGEDELYDILSKIN